ncbi:DUF2637 domain-containing protein [Streptomyces sp. NBC_01803]|uniref:DUF2637 domain-containing protein n=1 Tax=Streptomyces sp. NBC_01803 TaxID=2975946 RepID=UPI002DDA175C|nr:DUF2637 domain-containing protein [Streptomyces sp. NBC_01803]WSA44699.1 DUF2637 domain-containing protein [Streptomyces sp. NBC_01803]
MRMLLARVDAVLVQAVIAAALSFAHIHDLAAAAGQDGWKAWAYPVSVDLLMVAAWRRLRTGETKAAGWCWFLIALAASLGANIATAGLLDLEAVPVWLRILVAGWPAIAFLGGTLLAHTPQPAQQTRAVETGDQVQAAVPTPIPPALPVPDGLVAHARKVAAEHHARTGTPIDTPTLRARLSIPAPLAEAIAARLT